MGNTEKARRYLLCFSLLVSLLLLQFAGCSSGVIGEYECKQIDSKVALRSDGTFRLVRGPEIFSGTWVQRGEVIVLDYATVLGYMSWEMTISGSNLIDQEGKLWEKSLLRGEVAFLFLIIISALIAVGAATFLVMRKHRSQKALIAASFRIAGDSHQATARFCKHCGSELLPLGRYCNRCGKETMKRLG